MSKELFTRLKSAVYSNTGLLVLMVLFVVSAGSYYYQYRTATSEMSTESSLVEPVTEVAGPILTHSEPARIRIPKINIDTTFVAPLGLAANGEVAVPDSDTEVGWYQYSPTPGELGPSVVLGHVDSYTGPAVFFYLGQVEPGDDIYIDRADGSTAHFIVEELERPKQSEFPTARVYGNLNYAGLRLITCSGIYERGKQRYTHNLVVYARLVE